MGCDKAVCRLPGPPGEYSESVRPDPAQRPLEPDRPGPGEQADGASTPPPASSGESGRTAPDAPPPGPVVVIGDLEATRMVCSLLTEAGRTVRHLLTPDEAAVTAALTAEVEAVAVLVRRDVHALRYALLAEHLRPGIRLLVTVFDQTVAQELTRVVPNCLVTSPASVSVPSIVAGCVSDDALAVLDEDGAAAVLTGEPGTVRTTPWVRPRGRLRALAGVLTPRLRRSGDSIGLMVSGFAGILGIVLLDWVLSVLVLHEGGSVALYVATRVVTAVGPADAEQGHSTPGWYLVLAAGLMLLAVVFTAMFTAGLVDWLLSTRSVGLVGRRSLPSRDHVVVVGLGQIGLRVCLRLRRLGVPVVAIERDPAAVNLRIARDVGIPVLIGHAEDRTVMRRVGLSRARALAALGSDDLDNVTVAIAAVGTVPGLRVVVRAGEGDVVSETQSLFRIGRVVDVSALTAVAAQLSLSGRTPRVVFGRENRYCALTDSGEGERARPTRCSC